MFMGVLADAVSKGGGLGIGKMIASSLDKHGAAAGEDQHLDRPAEPVRGLPGRECCRWTSCRLQHRAPLPIDPARVSSNFGERIHPIDGTRHFHTGVDVRAAAGTPILAAAGGVVKRAGERGGYGNAVEIDHGNGVSTLYAHARRAVRATGRHH